jgi:hypothetical protein
MEKTEEKISMKDRVLEINEERNLDKDIITIGDLEEADVSIFDFLDMPKLKESKLKFTWDVLIKIAKVKKIEGISRDTPFVDAITPLSMMLSKGFLGKGSKS